MRIAKRTMAVLATGLVAVCCAGGVVPAAPGTAAGASAGHVAEHSAPVVPSLVYVRSARPFQIVRRDPAAAQEQVMYAGLQQAIAGTVPDSFGMLPSPDGHWLVVWEARFDGRNGQRLGTTWSAVSAMDEGRHEIGEVAGDAQLLPYWPSDAEVTLEGDLTTKGDGEQANFDVRTRTLAGSLQLSGAATSVPGTADWWIVRTRLELYAQRHHLGLLQRLPQVRQATSRLRGLWPDTLECQEPDEYQVLRALGIPGLRQLHPPGRRYLYPEVAFSPGAHRAAVAWISQQVGTAPEGIYARVDVVDLESGQVRPLLKVRWEGQRPSPQLAILPLVPEQIQPHAGDVRWSEDGRFLSYTLYDDVHEGVPAPSVRVVETSNWKEVLRIRSAMDAFVVPSRAR